MLELKSLQSLKIICARITTVPSVQRTHAAVERRGAAVQHPPQGVRGRHRRLHRHHRRNHARPRQAQANLAGGNWNQVNRPSMTNVMFSKDLSGTLFDLPSSYGPSLATQSVTYTRVSLGETTIGGRDPGTIGGVAD